MKKIKWNPEKSLQILNNPDRGISFEFISELIQSDLFLDIGKRDKYPDQRYFVIPINDDVWCVPFRESEDCIFLITAWPDRKLKRIYKK